ncbi:hypothetical protein E1B28_001129 [Marasmius oreades]|uniref:Uncharacterized protein n=1 Tax=Marasmius oreades TaxID=181124 RepID=A0A9P8AF40_9AGAR|nr:uncharacterized protein E1B28_001129 [Marasmius oreades]KAG7099269.1 hypothetical protein E1B28_001129 [Marasmius oreades]
METEEVSMINDQTLPGAWPITPLHKRTHTYPLQPQERVVQLQSRTRSLLQRHQQTRSALSGISCSCGNLVSSSSSFGVPSDDSNLTRFTPSNSAFAVHSLTSSPSSIASSTPSFRKRETSKPGCVSPLPLSFSRRIQPPPVPNDLGLRANNSSPHALAQLPSHADVSLSRTSISHSMEASFGAKSLATSSPHSRFTSSQSSARNLDTSLSPIIFTSPTSSNIPRRNARGNSDDAYDYSSFWKSSGDEDEFDDSRLLQIGTPSPTPSPSPSPVSVGNNRRRDGLTVSVTSPSVDELVLPQAMLTTLSLPGTLNDDSFSLNLPVPFEPRALASYANYTDQESSATPYTPSLAPYSETSDFVTTPTSTTSPLILAPARLEDASSIHAVYFSQSTHTLARTPVDLSPSTPATEERDVFSAADFAHAVVMSSWGNPALGIEAAVAPVTSRTVDGSIIEDVPQIQTETPVNTNRSRRSITFTEKRRPRGGILSRVKKLGNKVKAFLMGKPRPPHRYVLKRSITVQESLDVVDITGNQSPGSQILPRLELELGGEGLALATRTRRCRPGLTPETYTPAEDPVLEVQDRVFPARINRNSPDTTRTPESDGYPRDELQVQLAEHARPKTVNEIKARRPFSFSAFSSNLTASSSNTSNLKSRPVSDFVLASHTSYSGQGRAIGQHRGYVANRVILPPRRYSYVPPPPGLTDPASSGAYSSTLPPNSNGDHHSTSGDVQTTSECVRPTDTRRYSLSALSSFAAGLKHRGTWARYS